jgi:hypothetical protein
MSQVDPSKMSMTQALTQALVLSLTASTDAKSAMAIELAESFACRLTIPQVEACKAAAKEIAEAELERQRILGE